VKKALESTNEYRPLVLKRTRDLINTQIDFEKEIYELGSVAIIAYKLQKEQSKKRAAVVRALIKTPRIKIGQSLYLIPYLRASKLEAYKGKVMLQDELFDFLKEKGIDAHRLTYLKIIYPTSHKVLLKMMIDHERLTCQKLTSALKQLITKINKVEPQDLQKFRKIISSNNVRYRAIRGIIFFINIRMRIDLRYDLKKAYNTLSLCKKIYRLKQTELLV
jgi:hypothetical protein